MARTPIIATAAAALVAMSACAADQPLASETADAQAAEAEPITGGVTVEAVGTVDGTPDVLSAHVGVEVEADDLDGAYTTANRAATQVRDALVEAGVDASDIQTAQMSLGPRSGDDDQDDTYVASTQLRVELRDLDAAGTTLDAAVTAAEGYATLSSVGFSLDDDSDLVVAAREAAYEEALAKAEQYAELAGRPLGALTGVSEATDPYRPFPTSAAAETDDAAGPPVEPGTEEIQIRIRATWALD